MQRIKFAGLDVHADTIAVAVAEQGGEIRSLGTIPNREESVRKLVKKLGTIEQLRFCYEAGPTGYVLYWQLTKMGAAPDGSRLCGSTREYQSDQSSRYLPRSLPTLLPA